MLEERKRRPENHFSNSVSCKINVLVVVCLRVVVILMVVVMLMMVVIVLLRKDFLRFGVNAPWIPVRFAKDFRKRFTRDARCFSEDVGDVLFRGDGVNPNFLRRRSRSSFNFKSLARSSFVSFSIVV